MEAPETGCCPRFDPEPWQDRTLTWEDRRFVRDRVRSLFHIPINFGAVMRRNMAAIEAAGVCPENPVVLSAEGTPWGSDVLIEVTGEVPGKETVTLSGTFLSKVFEGPYRDMGKWCEATRRTVADQGMTLRNMYTYYTTCPKCAKVYGKNYVVLLAHV